MTKPRIGIIVGSTRATRFADKPTEWIAKIAAEYSDIAFEVVAYDYDPTAERVGLQAAEALGEEPHRVLKTLIAEVDGKPVCVVLASDREASMKKVASAFSGKSAAMAAIPDAERITGYKVGGVSPFGQKKKLRTVVDAAALTEAYVYVNGEPALIDPATRRVVYVVR